MKLIKSYLTSEEIFGLVNTLVEIENPTEREVTKYGVLYQLLVKDAPQLDTCNEYFDLYAQGDFNFDCLPTVRLVDRIVAEKLSTTQVIKNFLDELNNKIDEYGKGIQNMNIEETISQLKGLIGDAKL